MVHDSCEEPRRDTCETKDVRKPRPAPVTPVREAKKIPISFLTGAAALEALRAAKAELQSIFRPGTAPVSPIRPANAGSGSGIRAPRGAPPNPVREAKAGGQTLFRQGVVPASLVRAANTGTQQRFRVGVLPVSPIRASYHCRPEPEYELVPVDNESGQFVYNESDALVFCMIRVG